MNWDAPQTIYGVVIFGLIALRYFFELWLDWLNSRHVKNHANVTPEPLREIMDDETYQKSVRYTLAKSRLGTISATYSTAFIVLLLFSGFIAN